MPLQPMEVHSAAEIPLQSTSPQVQPQVTEGGCASRGCDPMGSLQENIGVGRICGPMSHYGAVEKPVPGELHFAAVTSTGAVHEELHPVETTCIGEIHEGISTIGGIPCWSRA